MHNYHCSKCKKLCQKKDGKWNPNCECGIRCSPNWPPPSAAAFSEGITRAFSLTEPEPEPEPEPIGEWLSQELMNPVKKGVKVVPTRMEKRNPDKPSVRAYRVKKGVEENSDKSKMKSKMKSKKKSKKRKTKIRKSKKRKTKRRKSKKRINKY
jgi:hypothetical protein